MKEGHEANPVPESYPGEMERYVEAFVKDKVFHRPDSAVEEAKQISGPLQAVDWGVSFERRSIDFYTGMKGIVRAAEQKHIDAVITEEQNHIRRLLQVAARLRGDESS
jgi:rubrerythrin